MATATHFTSADRTEIYRTADARGDALASFEHDTFVELTITGAIEPHAVPLAMRFYVVAGSGICTVDGEALHALAGDVLAVAPGATRGWQSTGEQPLKLLAIRTDAA